MSETSDDPDSLYGRDDQVGRVEWIFNRFMAPLLQDPSRPAVNLDGLVDIVQDLLKYSVNTWNPKFMDKLYTGTHPIGVVSELLCATLNNNCHIFRAAPVLTTYVYYKVFYLSDGCLRGYFSFDLCLFTIYIFYNYSLFSFFLRFLTADIGSKCL